MSYWTNNNVQEVSGINNNLGGTLLLYTNTTGQPVNLLYVRATVQASVTVGNRQLALIIKDSAGTGIMLAPASNTQAASLLIDYYWANGLIALASATGVITGTLPASYCVMPPGSTLSLTELPSIDATDAVINIRVVFQS